MTAVPAGDLPAIAAYGAYHDLLGPRAAAEWVEQTEEFRTAWRAAADAARTVTEMKLSKGVAALLARVQASADATRPSRKTSIEDEVAAQLRQLLEDTTEGTAP